MKVQEYEMKREEVPECWLKPEQLDVLKALCIVKGYKSISSYMVEATLDQARRDTDSDLSCEMRKKLGKEWDY